MKDPAVNSLPAALQWTRQGRALIFLLSASSIWCLLLEMYGLCSMRTLTYALLVPSSLALAVLAWADRAKGDGRLWRAVVIGAIGGFLAACAYDLFRLPWVIGAANQVGPSWLRLPLFKVFPRFGAMILGLSYTSTQPDSQFPLAAHALGWIYHFSNGITFGIMFLAIVGTVTRGNWRWALALAAGIEILMLVTPYPSFFAIPNNALLIAVTHSAHFILGAVLGWYTRIATLRFPPISTFNR
jgi:hypothetical protein